MRTLGHSIGVLLAVLLSVLVVLGVATTVQGATAAATSSGFAPLRSQPVDLLYISDSSGWGVARSYARLIRHNLGAVVRVHDQWKPDLAAATILKRLRKPSDPWVRLIRNAEVIVVYGNPVGLGIKAVQSGACVDGSTPPPAIGPRTWQPYVATLKAIYKRIFAIRKGKPVILRTANWYVPIIYHGGVMFGIPGPSWKDSGIVHVCTKFEESHSAAIARAAKAYRVPMADVYSAFNGPNHLEDPVAKGYLQADNLHPNNKGRAVIARALAALGYKRVKPPQ